MEGLVSKIDHDFIEKYNSGGPYYVCYPTVGKWFNDMSAQNYKLALAEEFGSKQTPPLYLYVHYPFCPKLCYYCHCHVVITKNQKRMSSFLDYICKEIDLVCAFFEKQGIVPNIKEIHLGGGSPSVMTELELERLVSQLKKLVKIEDLDEFSIEIDVRTVTPDKVKFYSKVGIDRLSFGIQDFNPAVQLAINRVQPLEQVKELVVPEIRQLFKSINFDMIYGLPLQTRESFHKTIEALKEISPDRICLYHYNHRPDIYPHQATIKDDDVPEEYDKSMTNIDTIRNLLDSDYVRIGLDHFAKRKDELAVAVENNYLHRSFIGYTAGRTHNILGIGPSSISDFGDYYFQNIYSLDKYYEAIEADTLPILRGIRLTLDEKIREDVILKIISNFYLDFREIEKKYNIQFDQYFARELQLLDDLIKDEVVILSKNALTVTPLGEYCVRYVCMIFDWDLQEGKVHRPTSRQDDKIAKVT
jgi:oxygen-independent coproporphyrinogen III oxidase